MQRYHSVFFQYMRKMSLVNETLRPETETRPRRLTLSPRRDRDRDVPTFLRDRDETETLGKCVSRPSRDRDVETETTSLSNRLLLVTRTAAVGENEPIVRRCME